MSRFDKPDQNKFEKVIVKGKKSQVRTDRDKSPSNTNNISNISTSNKVSGGAKKLVSPRTTSTTIVKGGK